MEDKEIKISPNFWRDDLDNREVMVSIHCITYNQEKYISEALEGFITQKTNFRFEAIVHDDASTDPTPMIIKKYTEKYPSIIKPIFEKENQWSKKDGSLGRIMNAHMRGKYVAFCEGDDYWIDPLKLQKQVDFLESHPDFSCVHTAFKCVDENSNLIFRSQHENFIKNSVTGERFWYLLLNGNYILTCTFMIRKDIFLTHPLYNYDYGNFLKATRKGLIKFLPDHTACYRKTPGSILNNPENNIKLLYLSKVIIFNEVKEIIDNPQSTISKVLNFSNKVKAITRMLIFCLNTNDLELQKRIFIFYLRHPKLLFNCLLMLGSFKMHLPDYYYYH